MNKEQLRAYAEHIYREALPPSHPSMESIMLGNGHPDEGPCVVCGHVFDAHAEGCVFDKTAHLDGLRKAWAKLKPWVKNLVDSLDRTDVKRDDGVKASKVVRDVMDAIDVALAASAEKARCVCCDNPAREGKLTCAEHDSQEEASWDEHRQNYGKHSRW